MFQRLRRYRRHEWVRQLFAEVVLRPADLIQPIFLIEGTNVREEIATMPGIYRLSVDQAVEEVKKGRDLGVKLFAFWPKVDPSLKSDDAKEAFNENNLMCRAGRAIKAAVPDVGLMGDVALDPYTLTGHDGIVVGNDVDNDITVDLLVKQAATLAKSGYDVIAPSDMMDGRIAAVREYLEEQKFHDIMLFSYSAKYATAFYGPFRDAIGSTQKKGYLDKKTYQLTPYNRFEARLEMEADVAEAADALIIKPGLPYLDIMKEAAEWNLPVIAFQVSGEYAMLKHGANVGILDFDKAMLETLAAFKRAGAQNIITYSAMHVAGLL